MATTRPGRSANQWGRAIDLGLQFSLCVVVGMVLGYYLDRWFDTGPVLLFVFMGFGFAAGMRVLLRFARSQATPGADSAGGGPDEGGAE